MKDVIKLLSISIFYVLASVVIFGGISFALIYWFLSLCKAL